MEYYIDISTDQFEKIRDHETNRLELPRSLAEKATGRSGDMVFKEGDGLKLYHTSEFPEALRVEVISAKEETDSDVISLEIRLNEWMMAFPE